MYTNLIHWFNGEGRDKLNEGEEKMYERNDSPLNFNGLFH
jgi:hypothetical protein